MNIYRFCLMAVLSGTAVAWGQIQDTVPKKPTDDGVEILTRGPVHEAFAETVTFDPDPGIIVPKMPPAAIEESPPAQRLEGKNISWIPGYWSWDDDRDDFIWVSGIWRALPPGRQWVPGYWGRSGQGAQWTSGYWADAAASEVTYLLAPPASMELGPNIDAPSQDHNWIPGNWVWQSNRYAWRPGFWSAGNANWDWVPAHYVWTPRGYVFVDGYYDYSVARRGVLYAPVYFNANIASQRGFSYSPSTMINLAVFGNHLFLRPSYGHYYFGDYYATSYTTRGYSPGYSFYNGRNGYDPFFTQQRWQNRFNANWANTQQTDFEYRRNNEVARPPRTWAEQRLRMANPTTSTGHGFNIAGSYDDLARNKEQEYRFKTLDAPERQQLLQHDQAVRQLREQREKLEIRAAERPGNNPQPAREPVGGNVKFPPSPFRGASPDRLDRDHTPPKQHDAPKLDMKIEPKPRKSTGRGK